MLQSPTLCAQLVFLALAQPDRVDLGELEAEEILLALPLARLLADPLELAPRGLPLADERRHAAAGSVGLRVPVQEVELPAGLHQALVLVLAVELEQRFAEALEEGHRGRRVVHEDAVPPGPRRTRA